MKNNNNFKAFEPLVKAAKNIDSMSLEILKIGLQCALGMVSVALILTVMRDNYGNYIVMSNYVKNSLEAAATCAFISVFFAVICDAAVKDKKGKG